MKDMKLIQWLIILAIVLMLVAIVAGYNNNGGEFEKACNEARGTTVWDGRQYQCIKH